MRILLIEDDRQLCASLKYQLEADGFDVDVCHDGDDGLFLIREESCDLVLLDRMLPLLDGLTVLKRARQAGVRTPIILVTALGELCDRVEGLNLGADDYIVKPFAFEELLARIHSCLRRPPAWTNAHLLSLGDIVYDSAQKLLKKGERSCSLSKREGELLELFLRNPNQTLPRLLILNRVWGAESDVEGGNLDNYIHFLRRRLNAVGSTLALCTVRGVGYRMEDRHDS